jgi:hypothetical protein
MASKVKEVFADCGGTKEEGVESAEDRWKMFVIQDQLDKVPPEDQGDKVPKNENKNSDKVKVKEYSDEVKEHFFNGLRLTETNNSSDLKLLANTASDCKSVYEFAYDLKRHQEKSSDKEEKSKTGSYIFVYCGGHRKSLFVYQLIEKFITENPKIKHLIYVGSDGALSTELQKNIQSLLTRKKSINLKFFIARPTFNFTSKNPLNNRDPLTYEYYLLKYKEKYSCEPLGVGYRTYVTIKYIQFIEENGGGTEKKTAPWKKSNSILFWNPN